MTFVKVIRDKGRITEVICDGHTGYAAEGEDIVCAALSSVVQTAVLGLMGVAGIPVVLTRREDEGYLKFTLPVLDESQRHDADMILETMYLGIADLHEGYSDFIKLEAK